MIKVKITTDKPVEIRHDVRFVNGEAQLDDNLLAKAKHLEMYYGAKYTIENQVVVEDEGPVSDPNNPDADDTGSDTDDDSDTDTDTDEGQD